MSLGQGINIKLFSGREPWEEQFYSSTCDQLYIGGQGGAKGRSNCPFIQHKDFGTMSTVPEKNLTDSERKKVSIKNTQQGKIDGDFFNRWFKNRPYDLNETGAALQYADYANRGQDSVVAPGVDPTWYTSNYDPFGNWAQKGNPYFDGGFTRGDSKMGANGWDWALQACRQEYGAYLNPDTHCDDPVCQMEAVAKTNPVYFESGCNTWLHHNCMNEAITKAVLEPVAEAVAMAALTAAAGGLADGLFVSGEVAASNAAKAAAKAAIESGLRDATESSLEGAARAGAREGEETAVKQAVTQLEGADKEGLLEDELVSQENKLKAEEELIKESACKNYSKGGIANSASVAHERMDNIIRAEKFAKGVKTKETAGFAGLAVVLGGGMALGMDAAETGGDRGIYKKGYQDSVGGAMYNLAKTTGEYNKQYSDSLNDCIKSKKFTPDTDNHTRKQQTAECQAKAASDATKWMSAHTPSMNDVQSIGRDADLARNWHNFAELSSKGTGLLALRRNAELLEKAKNADKQFAAGLSLSEDSLGLGGLDFKKSMWMNAKCNKGSMLFNAVTIAAAGLLADGIAHEECYTCDGNTVQYDKNVKDDPFSSSLGIKAEKPYGNVKDDQPIPTWHADIVKPYCFVPNRRGASNYCPIFGDTLALERKDLNWVTSNSTDLQKYKGSILGTTDYEVPQSRPFWTLNDTQSRVQTGKQGLHTLIEGDTRPDLWGTLGGLLPASEHDPENVAVTDGGRKWTNYGYVCNYNNTDDFINNPLQAQNFLDMTIGPIDTLNTNMSGMLSDTCASPLLLKDLQGQVGIVTDGQPETPYAREACMQGIDKTMIPVAGSPVSLKELTVRDKMEYYFSNKLGERKNVLGMSDLGINYQANTIPLPSNPNIPYNQNFGNVNIGREGSDDKFALLPSTNPQFTGALPWFQTGSGNYSYEQYQDTFDADNATYKLPATFWYEHNTFNKIMADYCIRKGPRFSYPSGPSSLYSAETAAAQQCMLLGGVASNAPAGIPGSPHAIRTYCPNMFLKSAGHIGKGGAETGTEQDACYNCSSAEVNTVGGAIPNPTDVCSRWYKGMIDSYKNLSNISKQNPTQIFQEYNKAVDEYCNLPEHRDLVECSCHNADNVNNPTEYNNYFDLWSSFENSDMGTKGMKYCWLTPCVPNQGGLLIFYTKI